MTRSIGPFLWTSSGLAEVAALDAPGGERRFDGGGEDRRDRAPTQASFLLMRTDMPPSGRRAIVTSSMKLRMKKMPRPLDLSMFSGVERIGDVDRDRSPRPRRAPRRRTPSGVARGVSVNSTVTCLARSSRLPCLMALMTDSRTATLTQCMASSSSPARGGQPVAQELHEVQQLERTRQLEADDMTVDGHAARVSNIYDAASSRDATDSDISDPRRSLARPPAVPGDKSISHRYVMLGAIARGHDDRVTIWRPAPTSPRRVACLPRAGRAIVTHGPDARLRDHGRGGAGPAAAAGAARRRQLGHDDAPAGGHRGGPSVPHHDDRRRVAVAPADAPRHRPARRPWAPGSRRDDGRAPLDDHGRRAQRHRLDAAGASAQIKSAMLLAGLSRLGHDHACSEPLPTRDHTERAFPAFGIEHRVDGRRLLDVDRRAGSSSRPPARSPCRAIRHRRRSGRRPPPPCPARRCSSTACCLNPRRLGFVARARAHGRRRSRITETRASRRRSRSARCASRTATTRDATIEAGEVPELIDELPVLAARAALGGWLDVTGAGELRVKESDRITRARATASARWAWTPTSGPTDSSSTARRRPHGGTADARGDHRLVMAFALVGLGATGPDRRSPAPTRSPCRIPAFDARPGARSRSDDRQDLSRRIHGERQEHDRARARRSACAGSAEDIDELIEARERRTIADIFAKQGEPYFRAVEREILQAAAADAARRRGDRRRHVRGSGEPRARSISTACRSGSTCRLPELIPRIPLDGRRPLAAEPRRARAAVRRARRHVPAGAHARRRRRASPCRGRRGRDARSDRAAPA